MPIFQQFNIKELLSTLSYGYYLVVVINFHWLDELANPH